MNKYNQRIKKLEADRDYYESKYYSLKNDWLNSIRPASWILCIMAGFIIAVLLSFLNGTHDSNIDKLGFDKNQVASWYVLKYYPEFKNCTIQYDSALQAEEFFSGPLQGVEIYCNSKLPNRDGLAIKDKEEPTKVIYFEKTNIDKIFEQYIKEKTHGQ
jgi:hypothetical protein